jgi:hypothetical protein
MANTSNRGDLQTGQAREQAEAAKGHLQQAGSEAKQAASAAASGLGQKVQDTASHLAQKAEDRTDDALSSVGQRMSSMAGSLRQTAPRSGAVGSAAGAVADRLESGGRYLQEHGVGEITDDIGGLIRRNPLPALCLAFGAGFVIGMVATRR